MAELTWQEQEVRASGVAVDETLFDGFKDELGGLYVAPKSAESEGAHYKQLIDEFESMNRRLGNAPQMHVYLDEDDEDDECSVSAETFEVGGTLVAYAGENAIALTAGATNYVYLDLSDLASPAAAVSTSGWPSTLHRKLATIAQPASGCWSRIQHLVNFGNAQAVAISGGAADGNLIAALNYNTSSPLALGTCPAGRYIVRYTVKVVTPFNGTAPTLILGDGGSTNRLAALGDIDLKTAGIYTGYVMYQYAAATALIGTYVADSSSAGQAIILLEQA